MKTVALNTNQLHEYADSLSAGDRVLLSGTVYTSRDAAHKRIAELLKSGGELPYALDGAVIYYAGPTPTPDGMAIGSCGPTTSSRMDPYTPLLYSHGVAATVGKGGRSPEVAEAICKYHGIYLCAIGGAGALAAECITECEITAFEDLGCEAVRKLTVRDFPLIVGIDCNGGNIFNRK